MKRILALALLVAVGACHQTNPDVRPVVTPVPPPVTASPHYGQNTPEETRAAHRLAIERLQASQWDEAFAAVDDVQPRDSRRRLTEYLELVAAVHLPDQALSADDYAVAVSQVEVEPTLLNEQQESLDKHRAWIAAVQDVIADEAEVRHLPRPMPRDLQHTHNLSALAAWKSRGATYNAMTYNLTKTRFKAAATTLNGRFAMDAIFAGISAFNVNQLLYVDLTPFHFDPQLQMALPAGADL